MEPRASATPALLGLTALALALRLTAIGSESLWYDEAISLKLAAAPYRDLLSGAARDNGNPWGYWLILRAWQALVGPGIETARALSALLGSLVVPATYRLARADGVRRTESLLAALLVAASPPLVFLGREARVYALFAVAAALTALAAGGVRRGRTSAHVELVLGGISLLYLHYYAFFVLAALALAIVWGRRLSTSEAARLAATYACIGLAFVPLLPLLRAQLAEGATRSESSWGPHAVLFPFHSLVGHTLAWKLDPRWLLAAAYAMVVLGVVLPAAWGLLRQRRAPVLSTVTPLATFFLVLLVSLRSPLLHSRYMAVVVPCMMISLVAGLSSLANERPRLARSVALLAATLIVASLARLYAEPHKPDWRGVAEAVGRIAPGLPVFFLDDTGALPYAYYRPSDASFAVAASADGTRWADDSALASMSAQPRGFWLALYLPYASAAVMDELTRELSHRYRVDRLEDRLGVRLMLMNVPPGHPASAESGSEAK